MTNLEKYLKIFDQFVSYKIEDDCIANVTIKNGKNYKIPFSTSSEDELYDIHSFTGNFLLILLDEK